MTSTERRRQLRVALLRRRELVALRAAAGRTPPSDTEPAATGATATAGE